MIKTHIPISHLHPDVVKISKVVVVMRNPKDCAASMFHHERLLPNHNLKHDFPFDHYAKNFAGQAGTTPIYGDYWAWIKVLIRCLTQSIISTSQSFLLYRLVICLTNHTCSLTYYYMHCLLEFDVRHAIIAKILYTHYET